MKISETSKSSQRLLKDCCEVMRINKTRSKIEIEHDCITNMYNYFIENIHVCFCPWCGTKLELEPEEHNKTWYLHKILTPINEIFAVNKVISRKDKLDETDYCGLKGHLVVSTKSIAISETASIQEIYKKLEEVK